MTDPHSLTSRRVLPAERGLIRVVRAVSWKQNMFPLSDITLEAAGELSQYSEVTLRIDPLIAGERINSSFRAGDEDGFAAVLAGFLPVRAQRLDGGILIRPAEAK